MRAPTRSTEFVADTIAVVLRLEKRKMGPTAQSIFASAEAGDATIFIPGLVFAEVLYLSEKRRISISLTDVADYLIRFPPCTEIPLSFDIVQCASTITDVPELHDRLIAATARKLNVALITNDAALQSSAFVNTVW
ncbi:MAG: PIN domain-containing protein [Armatimonadetes bacterium]|nr:PIN domain-containing protein [Armatimonadota bacterium]